ncbi:MAG: cysteine desulfurase [Puniceicoccales bacterium]|jgi:cysteine desulfurase/selenocysteine lyase|nr:cysteine desulfurase [Puniceicoccales bacterium]
MDGDFPALARQFPLLVARPGLAYLDNAATTQLHGSAIGRLCRFLGEENATVHRSACALGSDATVAYAGARASVADYVGADMAEEIVFVRGTTEAINLAARCWGKAFLGPGDEILASAMEHHSNFLPWQELARERGASLQCCAVTANGELDREDFEKKLSERTRLVALVHVSNVLGTVNPLEELIRAVKRRTGAAVLVDGAQRISSGPIDVKKLGCDFYAFSGHKAFAPMGIGVLYGRMALLDDLPPYQFGGGMVERVGPERSAYKKSPEKWEAGTPNVAGALALQSALEFLRTIDWQAYAGHCQKIRTLLEEGVKALPGVRILGNSPEKASIFSFASDRVHGHDIAAALASRDICVRAGHHCAQPLHAAFAVPASCRASFSLYNTLEEGERLLDGLRWALSRF